MTELGGEPHGAHGALPSDADRERVVGRLVIAVGQGQLELADYIDVDDSPNPDAPVVTLRVFSLLGGIRITRTP